MGWKACHGPAPSDVQRYGWDGTYVTAAGGSIVSGAQPMSGVPEGNLVAARLVRA